MATFKDYKDITGFLLGPVRTRPGMYLGTNEISKLQNFIFGYSVGFEMAKSIDDIGDPYFGDNGFNAWLIKKIGYHPSTIEHPLLERSGNDQRKALLLYFELLEEFSREVLHREPIILD